MPKKLDSHGTSYSFKKINDKVTTVFIHGVGLTKEMWDPQINFFKEYNTLTYDLLGHGDTALKKTKINFDSFSKQLLNLINELDLPKIHLVGFSLGALIARHFASEHGDRLRSLIIHGSIYKRDENQKRIVLNRFSVAKLNKPASKHGAIRRWLSDDFIKKNPKIYGNLYQVLDKNNQKNFLKIYELFVNYIDDDTMIKKIETKALITTGENDIGSTPEMSKNLSKVINESKFVQIKKGKHLCSIECANDVNMIFKEFIDRNND